MNFLRQQNSKLMEELATLKDKLEKTSGVASSPWSTVGGGDSSDVSRPHGRHGRHGSRTPRARVREVAASPERKETKTDGLRYTPNGTQVPEVLRR